MTVEGARQGPLRSWLGLAGFYTASFAVLGVYMQFFPVWLCFVQGFSKEELAMVLAAQTVARTIAGPFWAQHVDRSGNARRVLTILSAGALGAFALFGVAKALPAACAVGFLFGCLYPPIHPILDAAAVQVAAERGFSFGRVRMVGSLSYLAVIVAAGYLLEGAGTWLVHPLLLAALALTTGAARFLPRGGDTQFALPPKTPWWSLLRTRPFVWLLVAAALVQGSHATFYNLSTVHWTAHGITKSTAALLWAEGVLAEIVLFWVAPRLLDSLRPTTLMMAGAAAAVVRWIVIGATVDVVALFAVNWLHAASFAATYLGAIRALDKRVPGHQRSTAQGLLAAATSGGGMTIAGLAGGFAYERWLGGAFFVMAGFAAAGGLLALRLRRSADQAQTSVAPAAPSSPP